MFLVIIFSYYEGLQKCVGLYSKDGKYSPDQIEQLDALYKSLRQQYNWSSAVKVKNLFILLILNILWIKGSIEWCDVDCIWMSSENTTGFSSRWKIPRSSGRLYKASSYQGIFARSMLFWMILNWFGETYYNLTCLMLSLQGVPSLFSDLSPLYDHPGKVSLSFWLLFFWIL